MGEYGFAMSGWPGLLGRAIVFGGNIDTVFHVEQLNE
jgi:hypothetical protein